MVQDLYKCLSQDIHKTPGHAIGDTIFFSAPPGITQAQQCFLSAIVREVYGKAAVLASTRPEQVAYQYEMYDSDIETQE